MAWRPRLFSRAGTPARPRPAGRVGDRMLMIVCGGAGLFAAAVLVEVLYQLIHGAAPSISHNGLGFLTSTTWAPNFMRFGAATALYGTAVASLMALVIATPLGIAIGLYLSMFAPRRVRTVLGPLVEMLAAVPSVILGFWGVIVLAPYVQRHVAPALHRALGFLPIFGSTQTTGLSTFTAGLILAFMVLPIISALSRDLFLTVPRELKDGAEALGATKWEVIRGVVLPTTVSGVAAATVLGLGRALGEAIAVSFVIGDGNTIQASLLQPGVTLASRIASDFPDPENVQHTQALYYLALILLVIGLITSLIARVISGRFDANSKLVTT